MTARALIWIGTIEIVYSALVCTVSAVGYHIWTRGQWRRTRMGQHLFYFMTAFAANLLVSVVRLAVGNRLDVTWFAIVRAAVFTTIPLVLTWRFWIIYKTVGPGARSD